MMAKRVFGFIGRCKVYGFIRFIRLYGYSVKKSVYTNISIFVYVYICI